MVIEYQERKKTAQERRQHQAAKDRLQPALFDRLTDHAPTKTQEVRDVVHVDYEVLRAAILRDLAWLLNTVNLESIVDLDGLDEVKKSSINFGVSPLAGRRMSEIDHISLQNTIRDSIVSFEPRLIADSLTVKFINESNYLEHHNVLTLIIKGMMWCNPYPREFLLRTSLDLESGHMDIKQAEA
ncbi:MAG: type VI secretion system baseplate subunit TssE [Alcaligenaceae bacterium]|nr:type VI secretion system baseplate subunit TssE [Alcaligenaceae bacterium]